MAKKVFDYKNLSPPTIFELGTEKTENNFGNLRAYKNLRYWARIFRFSPRTFFIQLWKISFNEKMCFLVNLPKSIVDKLLQTFGDINQNSELYKFFLLIWCFQAYFCFCFNSKTVGKDSFFPKWKIWHFLRKNQNIF